MVLVYEQSDKTVSLWKELFWKGARKKATLKQITVSHRPVLSEKRAAREKKATATLLKSTSIYKLRETSFWGRNYLYGSIQTVQPALLRKGYIVEFHICSNNHLISSSIEQWKVHTDSLSASFCLRRIGRYWWMLQKGYLNVVMFPHFILSDWFEKLCSTCRTGSCTHMTFCRVQSQLILWGHI